MILESEGDITVVGEAEDGAQAFEIVRRDRPDVVLMDVRMPVLDGIAATARIVAAGLPTRVLVLTTFDLDEVVFEALRAGAAGFLLKTGPADDLVRAVRVVAAGESLLSPSVTRRLVEEFARRPSGAPPAAGGRSDAPGARRVEARCPRPFERGDRHRAVRRGVDGEVARCEHPREARGARPRAGRRRRVRVGARRRRVVLASLALGPTGARTPTCARLRSAG